VQKGKSITHWMPVTELPPKWEKSGAKKPKNTVPPKAQKLATPKDPKNHKYTGTKNM